VSVFNDYWYHGLIRKYSIAFASLFNEISIVRRGSDGSEVQRMVVPLAYGPKEKYIVRLRQDPTLTNPLGIVLPRMAYEITGVSYDAPRKLNRMNRRLAAVTGDKRTALSQFVETPQNLSFALHVMTKNTDDGLQILEHIVPLFVPEYTLTIKTIDEMGLFVDCPVVMGPISMEDSYEGDFVNRRVLTWTIQFTMKAVLYGPIKRQRVITSVSVDTYTINGDDNITPPQYLQLEQGGHIELEDGSGFLLTEDDPETTSQAARVSRTTVVPNPEDAQTGDNIGYTVTYQEFVDGQRFNPTTGEDEDL
jgi:hypothetical protein